MGLAEKLDTLPVRPGVYLFKDGEGHVLYVGKARVLRDRVRSYFQAGRPVDPQRGDMVSQIADLDLVVTDTEMEAMALENNFIKRHQPRFNILLRDDKNHPYLKLTLTEEYPRLHVVRRVAQDGNAYGGPYIPAKLGRRTASMVHRIFGVRSCKETLNGRRPRPCLQYQIKRCLAPCVAEVCSMERYREAAHHARLFLEGRTDEVVRGLRVQMEAAAGESRFEEAATLRDHIRALERLEAPQKITTTDIDERDLFGAHVEWERAALQVFSVREGKVVGREGYLLDRVPEPERFLSSAIQQYYADPSRYVPREVLVPEEIPDRALLEQWLSERRGTQVRIRVPQRGEKVRLLEMVMRNARLAFDLEWRHPRTQSQEILRGLQDLLGLEVEPRRVECFDISNIQGSDIVASMVAFEEGLPRKSDYRKFRVKGTGGVPDDFASMREVVGRRYSRLLEEGKELPDLVLIDGGKGQLSAATEALAELGLGDQPVASLAKREELIFLPGREEPVALPRSSPVLQFVQRVRDEAHRFAIGFHRLTRSKRTLRSELDDIPGVGPIKRRKLLSRFGSLRGVRGASIEELTTAVGRTTAERIRAWLDRSGPGHGVREDPSPSLVCVDTGTTNTRVWLVAGDRIVACRQGAFGARDTAREGHDGALRGGLRALIGDLLCEVPRDWPTPRAIAAAGMITSPQGLVEVPHVPAPAGLAELAAAAIDRSLPDVSPLPFVFVPGVKTAALPGLRPGVGAQDVMRGEETLCAGLLRQGLLEPAGALLNIGSHWKLVQIDEQGRIAWSITSLAGEMVQAVRTQTILASGLADGALPEADHARLREGMAEARGSGLARALFCVRLLQLAGVTAEERLSFLLGAFIGAEMGPLLANGFLAPGTAVTVSGGERLGGAWNVALEEAGCRVRPLPPEDVEQGFVAGLRAILEQRFRRRLSKGP